MDGSSDSWLEWFLEKIEQEYTYDLPPVKEERLESNELQKIKAIGNEEDEFDKLFLKKNLVSQIENNTALIIKRTCIYGSIVVVMSTSTSWPNLETLFSLWWRCIHLLNPSSKPAYIIIFASHVARIAPPLYHQIGPQHVNGGYTYPCDASSIVVYRKEEATRVLIHELFHASCSDTNKLTHYNEADCEAWAELFLCGILAKGRRQEFNKIWKTQLKYALTQQHIIEKWHNVKTYNDYAWRYIIHRVDVWRELGFKIPELTAKEKASIKYSNSLRFTYRDF
jgi:hypothetical protein